MENVADIPLARRSDCLRSTASGGSGGRDVLIHPALDLGNGLGSAISFPLEQSHQIYASSGLPRNDPMATENIDCPGRERMEIRGALQLFQAPLVPNQH